MTEDEWKNLKIGDKIKFKNVIEITGEILDINENIIIIKWNYYNYLGTYSRTNCSYIEKDIISKSSKIEGESK